MFAIETNEVTKFYKNICALKSLSIQVPQGCCMGLLGPNGAGKTTLMRMLYALAKRTSGTLRVFGKDPEINPVAVKKALSVLPQEDKLDDGLTVFENLWVFSRFLFLKDTHSKKKITSLLQKMGLEEKRNEKVRALSGGMKRRLAFARALLGEKALFILDEPTTGLDPAARLFIWNQILDLKVQGKTILLSTHYLQEAETLCDQVVILDQGKKITQGSPQTLVQAHVPGWMVFYKKSFLLKSKVFAQRSDFWKEKIFYQDVYHVVFHVRKWNDIAKIQQVFLHPPKLVRPSQLEDVFLKLTGKELSSHV